MDGRLLGGGPIILHILLKKSARSDGWEPGQRAPMNSHCMTSTWLLDSITQSGHVPGLGSPTLANHEGAGGSLGGLLPSLSQPPVPWQTPAGLSELEVLGVRLTLMVNRDIPNLEELEQCGHHRLRARR